jgi:hypothetical protein
MYFLAEKPDVIRLNLSSFRSKNVLVREHIFNLVKAFMRVGGRTKRLLGPSHKGYQRRFQKGTTKQQTT